MGVGCVEALQPLRDFANNELRRHSLRPTDDTMNAIIARLCGRKTKLKLNNRPPKSEQRLEDGLYFEFDFPPRDWVLSIYLNVLNDENDLEIAISVPRLTWPAHDPFRTSAATRWLEHQRELLEHAKSGDHKPGYPAFRLGLKAHGAQRFLARLAEQLELGDERQRWQVTDASKEKVASEAENPPAAVLQPRNAIIEGMLSTVRQTCIQSGMQSITTQKHKEWRFTDDEHFREHVSILLKQAGGHCVLTGVKLDLSVGDAELAPSLDRINSDGHYEPGNLQVVARFANRWKSDTTDAQFKRLLSLVRTSSPTRS